MQPHREGSILAGMTEHDDEIMFDPADRDLDEDDENPALPDQNDRHWETGIDDDEDADMD